VSSLKGKCQECGVLPEHERASAAVEHAGPEMMEDKEGVGKHGARRDESRNHARGIQPTSADTRTNAPESPNTMTGAMRESVDAAVSMAGNVERAVRPAMIAMVCDTVGPSVAGNAAHRRKSQAARSGHLTP
jgi:hypothetical protein